MAQHKKLARVQSIWSRESMRKEGGGVSSDGQVAIL